MNGINKDVSGARLLPTTVSAYPVDSVSFCHLLNHEKCENINEEVWQKEETDQVCKGCTRSRYIKRRN